MGFTTPGKPVDVGVEFPELAGLARTTVRLHPWQGSVTARESSLGGPLLWPAEEAWPVCTIDHPDSRPLTSVRGQRLERRRDELGTKVNDLARAGEHDAVGVFYRELKELEAAIRELRRTEFADDPAASLPMVPVAQFYARDVPELPFPEGSDVCQVLWCPTDHEPHYGPRPVVRWRDSASVTAVGAAVEPDPVLSAEESLPVPCRVWPERVVEFPHWRDLPSDEVRERVAVWEKEREWSYSEHLSVAPGSKVGGWVSWVQDPFWPECDRGHRMDHLLTVATGEWGDESWRTWMPLEERAGTEFVKQVRFALADGSTTSAKIGLDEQFDATRTFFGRAVAPETVTERVIPGDDAQPGRLDLMIGDVGDLYLFVCPTCPDRPTAVEAQWG
ncbi:hypothetical protein [Amycolatopsis samaneae]|uniref:Uncharacterized protein n=1 Tax=Amycolatopsis samaneae TaxID=664691 RepID=A0ABW5GAE9_9PSEU